jgi:hypothetical protein
LLYRNLAANGRQRILQHPPLAAVHVHVARSERRHAEPRRARKQTRKLLSITAIGRKLCCEPNSPVEALAEPRAGLGIGQLAGQPQNEACGVIKAACNIVAPDPVFALRGRKPRVADEVA